MRFPFSLESSSVCWYKREWLRTHTSVTREYAREVSFDYITMYSWNKISSQLNPMGNFPNFPLLSQEINIYINSYEIPLGCVVA